jgi:hypothetical protein
MPLELGYVDVRLGVSTATPELKTFPLRVVVAVPPVNEPVPPNVLALLATNPFDVLPAAGVELHVGAVVKRLDGTGQTVEFLIAPGTGLTDAEVTVRLNSSVFSNVVDYTANPTPLRGESFVVVGARSTGADPVPVVAVILAVDTGTGTHPHDITDIKIVGAFDRPCNAFVGQERRRTAAATFTSTAGPYRRGEDGLAAGMLLDLTAHDPGNTVQQTLNVDLTAPRSGDGPARAVVPVAGSGPGAIPVSGSRHYQVTWVHAHDNETSPSPPSAPISTTTGSVRVPLPVWTDPVAPGLLGPVVPEPIVGRRVYRTVTSPDGTSGEAFLVADIGDNTTTEFVDDRSDDVLGPTLLTDMAIKYRHTLDQAGTVVADGLGSLRLVVRSTSYEETGAGVRQFRGTTYDVALTGTPPSADITYDTRPTIGNPRVTWRSSGPAGPAGVGAARVAVTPVGVALGIDDHIDASVQGVPAAFGVDWTNRGATRTSVEVGKPEDVDEAIDGAIGSIVVRAASTDGTLPPRSPRAGWVEITPEALRFSARMVRRLRLLIGLPHPSRSSVAALDDGVVGEVEFAPVEKGEGPRSFRLLRDELTPDGRSRLMVRVGELPDEVLVDVRPGSDSVATALTVQGRLRRVLGLFQDPAQLAAEDVDDGRRRDGTWVAVHDTNDRLDVEFDGEGMSAVPTGLVRADLSLRDSTGLGQPDFLVRQAQASVSVASSVAASFPEGGATTATVKGGASGRLAVSTRALSADQRDRLAAVRATPQVKGHLRRAADDRRVIDDATARWLGLDGFSFPAAGTTDPFTLALTSTRANKAFRGHGLLIDDRIQPEPWDLLKARVVDLPESVSVGADTTKNSFRLNLNRRSGRVVLFAQPPIVPADGASAGTLVGVGLAKADADGLPTAVEVDLLGPANDLHSSVPFNATPDAGWRHAGFRVKPDGELVIRGLQLISVGFVRPVDPTAFWTNTAASLVRIAPEGTAAPGAVFLWTPAEPLPGSGASAGDWEDLTSWIGFKIEDPALVTLQIQAYKDTTPTAARFWNDGGFSWLLEAEFQMKDYRGEVTVDADLSPEGDDDAGPGKWYLRIPDGAPFSGQVVFGNTGGWVSNRPRIFEPFTP